MSRNTQKESEAVRSIIYKMAVEMGYGDYSTIDEIDYKFWEDVEPQEIAIYLAKEIVKFSHF